MSRHRRRAPARVAPGPPQGARESGLGLVTVAISLLIVGVITVVAMKAMGGDGGAGSGTGSLGSDVANAYAVEAQSNLSNAMEHIQDAALSDGGTAGLDLTQFGVGTGASRATGSVTGVVAAATDGGGEGGAAVTLAARGAPGTCWLVWFSATATWYGVEPGASSCTPPPLAQPPETGPASSGRVGWQQGSFPAP